MSILQMISNTHRDSILHQATLAKPVWDLAVKVMDMFEMGSLKDQKLNVKQLVSKPEFKQQHLAPLRALSIDDQCSILTKVVQKEIPLNSIKDLSKRAKQITTLKTLFARLTNTESWEGAQQRFPNHATIEKLERFVECDLKSSVPKALQDFCQRVVSAPDITLPAADHIYVHTPEEGPTSSAAIIITHYTEICGGMIRGIHPQYPGADLALVQLGSEVGQI